MQESKIHATERLRRERRWDEASAFRDEVRSRLRAEGQPKSEANEAAWAAMVEKFPPLSVPKGFTATTDTDQFDEDLGELAWFGAVQSRRALATDR